MIGIKITAEIDSLIRKDMERTHPSLIFIVTCDP